MFILAFCCMRSVPCPGQSNPEHGPLRFWTVGGSDGLTKRFGAGFSQTLSALAKNEDELDRILLAVAEQPLSSGQIADRSALPLSRVQHVVSELASIGLMRKYREDRWATTVPVVTDRVMKGMKEDMAPLADRVAQAIAKKAAQARNEYARVKTSSDPPWEDLAHLVIDKFLIDGTFHRSIGILETERGIRALYSESQQHLPAFYLEQGKSFSTFGTNWYPFRSADRKREVYVLHGAILDRFVIRLNAYREDKTLLSALLKMGPSSGLSTLSDQEKDLLRELQWTDKDRLLVPVVEARTLKSILPVIERMGREAAEVAFENFSTISGSFERSPYARFMDAEGDYIQICYHTLFSLILDRLVELGALPAIPKPVPEHFGVFIILGQVYD